MKLKQQFILFILITVACLLCVSCVKVNYPNRTQYMLNVAIPKPIYNRPKTRTIAIQNVTIAPQFAGLSFAYRTQDLVYTKDYYNIFFNPPAQQIEQLIVKYLQATNLFSYVSNNVNFVSPNYVLHADVTKLYADYRDANQPKAVIAIKYTVLRPSNRKKVVLVQTVVESIPLQNKDSQSLIKAWNSGLTQTLAQLTNNLKKINY